MILDCCRLSISVLILTVIAGCRAELVVPDRETQFPIQTAELAYELSGLAFGVEVQIPFRYTNRTGQTVSLLNCRGSVPPSLERKTLTGWVLAWGPFLEMCLSPPIVIGPGEEYSDTLRIFSGPIGSSAHPQFTGDVRDGIYRLVWTMPRHNYDHDPEPGMGFGDELPLEDRISNSFLLTGFHRLESRE